MEPETVKSVGEASELSLSARVCAPGSQRASLQGMRSSSPGPRTPWASSRAAVGPEVCPRGPCTSEASLHVRSLCALELPKPLPSENSFNRSSPLAAPQLRDSWGQGPRGTAPARAPGARAPGHPGGKGGQARPLLGEWQLLIQDHSLLLPRSHEIAHISGSQQHRSSALIQ